MANVRPKIYIPSKDSRHRYAVLTLYRHLLLQANNVPLPDKFPHRPGPRNPLAHQIRKAFDRNRPLTSPRFLSAALRNGYRGLSVLKEAADPANPRHREVIAFVRDRIREADCSRIAQPYTPSQRREMKSESGKRQLKRPILKRVQGRPPLPESAFGLHPSEAERLLADEKRFERGRVASESDYHYERSEAPIPTHKLGGSGRRIVPTVDHAFEVAPFLRYKKPQPRVLGTILHSRGVRWRDALEEFPVIKEELQVMARLEDEWDEQTGEAPSSRQRSYTMFDQDLGENIEVFTFSDAIMKNYNALQTKLNRLKTDAILRTQALMKIVQEEKTMAELEKWTRGKEKRRAYLSKRGFLKQKSGPMEGAIMGKEPGVGVSAASTIGMVDKGTKPTSAIEQLRQAYASSPFDEFGPRRKNERK